MGGRERRDTREGKMAKLVEKAASTLALDGEIGLLFQTNPVYAFCNSSPNGGECLPPGGYPTMAGTLFTVKDVCFRGQEVLVSNLVSCLLLAVQLGAC